MRLISLAVGQSLKDRREIIVTDLDHESNIAVWLALFGLGCFWIIRRKPLWVVPLPFIAAAFWLGGMNAGAAWLGWTP